MNQKQKRDFPAFRKARDALQSRFGTINIAHLVSQSVPYVIMFYLVDKEAWLYRNCIGGSAFDKLMAVTDLFMLDLKAMDSRAHISLTGVDNANILRMAQYLSAHGKKTARRILTSIP